MERTFVKMHGIGNDYIYFDCLTRQDISDPEGLSIRLSDRHFGIGGDGIVLILPAEGADATMRMFNADGSEGRMCGNAIRCVGKYLYEYAGIRKKTLTVQTLSGIKTLSLTVEGDTVQEVEVDMGAPILKPCDIPASFEGEQAVSVLLTVKDKEYAVTLVSMGNPHCVLFGEDPDGIEIEKIGPLFENHPLFPARINTEFVQVLGKNELKMRVWERGSGETLACGTGACAVAVAAVLNGYAERNTPIRIHLRGGTLVIRVEDTVKMTGPASVSFIGTVEI